MSDAPESALRAKPARTRTRAPNVTSSSASRRQIGQSVLVEVRGPTTPKARDARQLGRFRDDVARRRFLTAYDNALAAWPTPPSQLDVETRYGTTHVLAVGPESATPIVLLHATAVSSPSWFASVAALSEDRDPLLQPERRPGTEQRL